MKRIVELKKYSTSLPKEPGVYLMKNKVGQVIYIGKAKNLFNRVKSYFNTSDNNIKTKFLMNKVYAIEHYIVTNELEALLRESSLIKKYKPKYNIRLKDDKNYPYICLSLSHNFPRLYRVRKVNKNDSNIYFGPYASSDTVINIIDLLNSLFLIRDCSDKKISSAKRPCISYQINRCSAPCVKYISQVKYKTSINQCVDFLKGNSSSILLELEKEMKECAKIESFEKASKIRNQIFAIKKFVSSQNVIDSSNLIEVDVFCLVREDDKIFIEVLYVRSGKVLDGKFHVYNKWVDDSVNSILSFIYDYYEDAYLPECILVNQDIYKKDNDFFVRLFKQSYKKKIKLLGIRIKNKFYRSLLDFTTKSLASHKQLWQTKASAIEEGLESIKNTFLLKNYPKIIECVDVSHIQGSNTVASVVRFYQGEQDKSNYRIYSLDNHNGNDYGALCELLSRKFSKKLDQLDLLLVDGGRSQLNVALRVLKGLKLDIDVASIAKAKNIKNTNGHVADERFFIQGRVNSIVFKRNSKAFQILTSLRDEAHRFAIYHHRKKRIKTMFGSVLDKVEGLGEKRKKILLETFGSVSKIKKASLREIIKKTNLPTSVAKALVKTIN